jgi:tetratricopeptide (TPR) repeat protein
MWLFRDNYRGVFHRKPAVVTSISLSLRPVFFALVLLVLSGTALIFSQGTEPQSRDEIDAWTVDHFRAASEAHRGNNLEVAEKEYRLVLSRNPRFAEVYQNLGILYHQQRRYQDAVQTLQKAVALKADLLDALLFLGIDKYMVQDFKGAIGPLEKVLRSKPAERQGGLYAALTYLALDQPEKATRQLRKTAQYFPEDTEIAYHRGEAYLKGTQQRIALLHEFGDDSALSHWALAISAEQKGDLVGEIQEYLRALAVEVNTAELYWRLTLAFQKAGMDDMAMAALQRFRKLNPDWDITLSKGREATRDSSGQASVVSAHKDAILKLWESLPAATPEKAWPGIADQFTNEAVKNRLNRDRGSDLKAAVEFYRKGDYRRAAERINNGASRSGQDWVPAYVQARAYLLASDYERAEEEFDAELGANLQLPSVALLRLEMESHLAMKCFGIVLANDPGSPRAKLILAKSHAVSGRTEEAVSLYREVLKEAPDTLGIHLAIAQLYEDQLSWTAALDELKAELALAPENALALVHIGHVYTELQDADQAIAILTRLLAIHPDDGRACADLGKAWTIKGNTLKAIEAFERAVRYDPSQNNLHYRLFQLYSKVGDNARAKTHLTAFKTGELDKQQKQKAAMADLARE